MQSVMTFNLRYNEVKDGANAWPHRIDKVADIFERYRPVVVGTQEGLHPMLKDLQERLPGYGWIGSGRGGDHADEHNAIFYDKQLLSVAEWGQFWLSETPSEPKSKSWDSSLPRICTWARFRLADSPLEFMLYNTHLDHVGQEAREKGMTLIRERMRHGNPHRLPMMLTGDFNADPDNPVIEKLRAESMEEADAERLFDAYSALDGDPGLTAHSFKGGTAGFPIDYIFVSEQVRVLEVSVIRDSIQGGYPSDHYPVMAKIEIRP